MKKLPLIASCVLILAFTSSRLSAAGDQFVSVKDFGAVGNGVANDTKAIQAAFASVNSAPYARALLFPAGTYLVDHLQFNGAHDVRLSFNGAMIVGASKVPQPSVVTYNNAFNVTIDGFHTVSAQNRLTYACAVEFTTAPGVGTGSISRVNVHNMTCVDAQWALKINDYKNDIQCSELNFFGFLSIRCPQAVWLGGSQAGASFASSQIIAERNAVLPKLPFIAFRLEGGFLTVNGGEVCVPEPTGYGFYLNPCKTDLYHSTYPVVRVVGCHIECNAKLAEISNPRKIKSPYSRGLAQFSVTGCGGFCTPEMNGTTFVNVSDPTYAGKLQFSGCEFYNDYRSPTLRTAPTISGQPMTQIQVDKTSFGCGFKNWMGGVTGGILRHGLEQIVYADNLNNQSVAKNATDALRFSTQIGTGSYERYSPCYNSKTGVFTVPSGGLQSLEMSAICNVATAEAPTEAIAIYKNRVIDTVGTISGKTMAVRGVYASLPAGTTLEVRLKNTSSAAVRFGVSARDKLIVTASN
jgi:hypothetical protein